MDSHPDQEVAEALEPDGCPKQDSSPRESFLDSENLKVIQNYCERPDLAGKFDKEGAAQGGRDFDARCSPKNKDFQHEDGVQGRDLADACSGVWPVSKQETAFLDSVEESAVQLDKFPVPYLLRRVLLPEWAEINGDNYLLLAVTVQAIMLGSGFIGIDPTTRLPLHNAPVSSLWPKEPATAMSLQYSLPEILATSNYKTFQGVELKLQKLGHFLIVYGSLTPAKSELRVVHLDVTAFWPKLRLLMNFLNGNSITSASSMWATCRYPERIAFKLWKLLRDGLVLPLLIDLSDVAGSRAPSSFSDMPERIKLNILKRLKGTDLAKVGSVCAKLRQLSSNRNLWEKAYRDEFVALPLIPGIETDWKNRFARTWLMTRGHCNQPRDVLHPRFDTYTVNKFLVDPGAVIASQPCAPWMPPMPSGPWIHPPGRTQIDRRGRGRVNFPRWYPPSL